MPQQSGYFAKGGHIRPLVSSGGFSKTPTAKNGDFALRNKRREKICMANVVKCCHQVTWVQKTMTKKR